MSDQDIRCTFSTSPTSPNIGIVARYVNATNWLIVDFRNTTGNAIELLKFQAGVWTSLDIAIYSTVVKGATFDVRVLVEGSTCQVWMGGGLMLDRAFSPAEQAVFGSATKCGLALFSGKFFGTSPNDPGDSRFDNFQVGVEDRRFRRGMGLIRSR